MDGKVPGGVTEQLHHVGEVEPHEEQIHDDGRETYPLDGVAVDVVMPRTHKIDERYDITKKNYKNRQVGPQVIDRHCFQANLGIADQCVVTRSFHKCFKVDR